MSAKRGRDGDPGAADVAATDPFNKRRAVSDAIRSEVTRRVEDNDPEVLLDELCARWELGTKAATIDSFANMAFLNFGVNGDGDIDVAAHEEYGLRALDETIERHEQEAIAVFNALKRVDPAGERPELQHRATKVLEMVFYAKKVVLAAFQARLGVHQLHSTDFKLSEDLDLLLGSWTLRFRWIDQTKSTPLQKLLLHLLDTAMEKRYRKLNGWVYEPIVHNGHETHAWRQVCEIKQFVYASTKKEVYWEQWTNMTASGQNAKLATEHLAASDDHQFPFLRKDRGVFAFRNGVYLAGEDRFHRFEGAPEPLSDTVVAAKFFDADFDTFAGLEDWRDIPTPNLQRVMDHQEWGPQVQDWCCIMLGRLLYNINDKDGWQVVPFMHGQAAAGKSTLVLKVAKLFYEHADVGVVSNNMEKQFGLSAFWDKFLVCGPELGQGWRMEQCEFQSMVSGESVSVAAKFQKAFTTEWTVPVIMAGNEVPSFSDNAGSIQRRLLVFSFQKAVLNGDMRLGDKLGVELPAILVKCNRAYLDASTRWGGRNIWTVLPTYFHDTRAEIAQAVNSIEAFLVSNDVVIDAESFVRYKDFRDAWKSFAQVNGYVVSHKTITVSLFNTPFQKHGLRITNEVRTYGGETRKEQWVVGLRLVTDAPGGGGLMG